MTPVQYGALDSSLLWYGVSGDAVAAFLIARETEHGLHISKLGTLPEYRNRGYGRALLTKAKEIALAGRHQAMSLNVLAGNAPARALYERFGFAYVGSMKRYRLHRDALAESAAVSAQYDAGSYAFDVRFLRQGTPIGSGRMNTEIGGVRDLSIDMPDENMLPALATMKRLLNPSQDHLYYMTGDARVMLASDRMNIPLDTDILAMEYRLDR